ncbi:FecR domain-containing protein [Rapidithrix thailandica]|uniref:FecR domain-containing protein n=1 Tax=Rapidithrix thailandica TaxID=413964 RepID=A0AAW9S2A6_9BACT
MTFTRKKYLTSKLQKQGCTREELQELYYLMEKYGSDEELEGLMRKEWEKKQGAQLDEESTQFLLTQIRKKTSAPVKRLKPGFRQFTRIAASLFLLGALVWLTVQPAQKEPEKSEVKYLTKSTDKGQRLSITLADGSVVMLNAESSITYPAVFADTAREILLKGEAFFDVARNPQKPFVVESNGLMTTVLGTSFNIQAFPSDRVEVTVATGKVKVAAKKKVLEQEEASEVEDVVLVPNQQGKFLLTDHSIAVTEVDLTPYLAWKNNALYFEMVPLSEVMKTLERWYNVEISMNNTLASKCLVRANYKDENLKNVLNGLKLLVDFNYKFVNDRKVVITGKGCKN